MTVSQISYKNVYNTFGKVLKTVTDVLKIQNNLEVLSIT